MYQCTLTARDCEEADCAACGWAAQNLAFRRCLQEAQGLTEGKDSIRRLLLPPSRPAGEERPVRNRETMAYNERFCPWCGEVFTATKSIQRYCSAICQEKTNIANGALRYREKKENEKLKCTF